MPARLKITVCLGLLAGLLLSPRLWLSVRNYPLTPVLPVLRPIPPPFDYLVFAAMILLLGLIVVIPKPARIIATFVVLAIGYALFDQSRWQPWFYQYVFMLMAIGFSREDSAVQTCRLIVAGIYFWSGIQKLNPAFAHDTFSWMLAPLASSIPTAGLAFAAPIVESAIAIGLLTRRFRNLAVLVALAMHAFILASIGPFGHNHNRVVWPWNVAMGVLVIQLFWHKEFGVRDVFWGNRQVFQRLALLLFAVMPAFSLVNLWDSYRSFALYSGNQRKATIYMWPTRGRRQVAGRGAGGGGRLPVGVQSG